MTAMVMMGSHAADVVNELDVSCVIASERTHAASAETRCDRQTRCQNVNGQSSDLIIGPEFDVAVKFQPARQSPCPPSRRFVTPPRWITAS